MKSWKGRTAEVECQNYKTAYRRTGLRRRIGTAGERVVATQGMFPASSICEKHDIRKNSPLEQNIYRTSR